MYSFFVARVFLLLMVLLVRGRIPKHEHHAHFFACTINSSLSSPIESLLSRAHSKEKRKKRINISHAST